MCVIQYVHSCGHIRKIIYGKKHTPGELCLCGRIATQDCTDALCEDPQCSTYSRDTMYPITTTFDRTPMPEADLSLEEQLTVLDIERHQLNLAQSRLDADIARTGEEQRMLESESDIAGSRYADGERESLEGREAKRRVLDKIEMVAMEAQLNSLRTTISKLKIDENEAEIRRVREMMDELYNEDLVAKEVRDQSEFEHMLAEDSEAYVETNKAIARSAQEAMTKDSKARKA